MIADTSFLIDVMRSNSAAVQKVAALEKEGIQVSLTTVSIFELHVGLNLSSSRVKEGKKIERVLENLLIFPLDFKSAKEAGDIYAEKKRRGLTIDPEDAMIAGICRVTNEPLLTRNINHFSGIERITLESY